MMFTTPEDLAEAAPLGSGTDLLLHALGRDTTSSSGSTGEPSAWWPQQPEKIVGRGGHRKRRTFRG